MDILAEYNLVDHHLQSMDKHAQRIEEVLQAQAW